MRLRDCFERRRARICSLLPQRDMQSRPSGVCRPGSVACFKVRRELSERHRNTKVVSMGDLPTHLTLPQYSMREKTQCRMKADLTRTFSARSTGSQLPYCDTLLFYAGGYNMTDYRCTAKNASTYQTVDLTYSGQQDGITLSTRVIGLAFVGSTTAVTSQLVVTIAIPVTPTPSLESARDPPVAAIAGGAVGGTVALILACGSIVWLLRRRRRLQGERTATDSSGGSGMRLNDKPELADTQAARTEPVELDEQGGPTTHGRLMTELEAPRTFHEMP